MPRPYAKNNRFADHFSYAAVYLVEPASRGWPYRYGTVVPLCLARSLTCLSEHCSGRAIGDVVRFLIQHGPDAAAYARRVWRGFTAAMYAGGRVRR